ncbi:hypothetical protein NUK34_11695 [Kerstersia gyiorum]|uniref:hypothetical protein n=1 Tax=Kerstersia gyiorum TaxID=206506 RepID=UPI00214FF843|nr:hypothetical protein [Kerstersia gyiorum]MCR4159516.1 hypothetical protein [Kerstersia gyiorum]
MEWLSRIQIGADIATGLTIIGALLSWLIKSRADARKERLRGINDAARAVAVQSIQQVLGELSRDFNKIVVSASTVERRIDFGMDRDIEKWQNSVAKRLENGNLPLNKILSDLDRIREQISEFYESAASSRYVLFPALSSLPESKEIVSRFKEDYTRIGKVYNTLSGGRLALLTELQQLISGIAEYRTAHRNAGTGELVETFQSQAASIVLDADYADWVASFLPQEERAEFIRRIQERDYAGTDLISQAMLGVLGGAASRGHALLAQILIFTSSELQSARKQCKEFMIMLAAISSRLQSKDNGLSVPQLIAMLRDEEYFAVESEVR